jgi:hypothetical protein
LEVAVPEHSDDNPLDAHATNIHDGYSEGDGDYQAARVERAELVRRFLAVMESAGNPGQSRKLGSTVLQLTGQRPEHYWGAILTHGDTQRELLVFDDGTHGWSDEITYSDRPRTPADEIPPPMLEKALAQILADNGLEWPGRDARVPAMGNPSERNA